MGKLKNGKTVGKYEIMGEMIKGGDDRMVDWFGDCAIWLLRAVLWQKTGGLL